MPVLSSGAVLTRLAMAALADTTLYDVTTLGPAQVPDLVNLDPLTSPAWDWADRADPLTAVVVHAHKHLWAVFCHPTGRWAAAIVTPENGGGWHAMQGTTVYLLDLPAIAYDEHEVLAALRDDEPKTTAALAFHSRPFDAAACGRVDPTVMHAMYSGEQIDAFNARAKHLRTLYTPPPPAPAMIPARWKAGTERLVGRVFHLHAEHHRALGTAPCPACKKTLGFDRPVGAVVLGPGPDAPDQAAHREGQWYSALTVLVHCECLGVDPPVDGVLLEQAEATTA